jgi:hypothetical protein
MRSSRQPSVIQFRGEGSVSFARSDSVNTVRAASYLESGTSPSLSAVTASVHANAARSRAEHSGHSRQTFNIDSFCSDSPAVRRAFQCMSMQHAQPLTCDARR